MICHSKAIVKPEFITVITALPDTASTYIRHPGAKQTSQYKAADKLKITRRSVEVKNVVSSQKNKRNVHVNDNITYQGLVVKMNSNRCSVL